MHDLLRHVRAHGAGWAPEPRGSDRVAFVEGDVPAYPMPDWVWEPRVLVAAARLLRALHDATEGFGRAGRVWRSPAREPDEVICHNDFAPYNLVFRGGLPVAAIDFDHASPGPRVWDLAYLAYRLVPLAVPGNPDLPEAGDREGRLARLCEAYGGPSPHDVLAILPRRLHELAAMSPPAHAALYRADAAALRRDGPSLRRGPPAMIPRIQTGRLLLREWRDDDIDAHAAMVADPEVMAFLGGPLDRSGAWRQMALHAGHWALRGYGNWVVEADGRMIGRAGLWNPEGWPGLELGWKLAREAWGRGYATEAARAAMEWAWTELRAPELISIIHPDNARSIRVAERLGFAATREETVNGVRALIYAVRTPATSGSRAAP